YLPGAKRRVRLILCPGQKELQGLLFLKPLLPEEAGDGEHGPVPAGIGLRGTLFDQLNKARRHLPLEGRVDRFGPRLDPCFNALEALPQEPLRLWRRGHMQGLALSWSTGLRHDTPQAPGTELRPSEGDLVEPGLVVDGVHDS